MSSALRDQWSRLRERLAAIEGTETFMPVGVLDHCRVQQGQAVLLVITPEFVGRSPSERAALRGEPAAPLCLVGGLHSDLSAAALVELGVEHQWSDLETIETRQIELALVRARRGEGQRLNFEIRHVLDIAASLNAERDPDRLLSRVLESMRHLTNADAGSLYVVEDLGDGKRALRFRVAQNDTLGTTDLPSGLLPIDACSIVGHAVLSRQPLNLHDVEHLPPTLQVTFNNSFDLRAGYRTLSMLTVPLLAADGEVLGAVQLINRKRDAQARLGSLSHVSEQVLPFSERDVELSTSLAGAASIALVNARLTVEIRRLFDGFVRAAVFAIDSRDPCTSGHSLRVSKLSVALADAAILDPRFQDRISLNDHRRRRLEYAALLHDFGKIGVAEDVLLKSHRLHTSDYKDLAARFDVMSLSNEIEVLRRVVRGELEAPAAERQITEHRLELTETLGRITKANYPDPVDGEMREFLKALTERTWRDREGHSRPVLTPREHECLSIPYGSLTATERMAIQEHVVHTGVFLRQIPWGRELEGLADIAARHHEKLDGSGYPAGLLAEHIPIESRIITVVDIFDALTAADRPYKTSLPYQAACDILWSEANRGKLDSGLVEIFVQSEVHLSLGEGLTAPR